MFRLLADWKYQMHNRYWSDNNVYSTENGGKYKFLTEPSNPATNGTQNPQVCPACASNIPSMCP